MANTGNMIGCIFIISAFLLMVVVEWKTLTFLISYYNDKRKIRKHKKVVQA
jgi:NRPS condensation-like uncharacterized protein